MFNMASKPVLKSTSMKSVTASDGTIHLMKIHTDDVLHGMYVTPKPSDASVQEQDIEMLLNCLKDEEEVLTKQQIRSIVFKAIEKKQKSNQEEVSTRAISSRYTSEDNVADLEAYFSIYESIRRSRTWKNILLGNSCCQFFGLKRWKKMKTLAFNDPKAQALLCTVSEYCSSVHDLFSQKLIPATKCIAKNLYFQNYQIEADGLTAISGQIWTATLLMKTELREMLEVDYNEIRELYLNLMWEVKTSMRLVRKYHNKYRAFKKRIVPSWIKIENLVDMKSMAFPLPEFQDPKGENTSYGLGLFLSEKQMLSRPIQLYVSLKGDEEPEWKRFAVFPYAFRVQIIQKLIKNTIRTLQTVQGFFKPAEEFLHDEEVYSIYHNDDSKAKLSCTRSSKILLSSVKTLTEDVLLPSKLRSEVARWVTTASTEMRTYMEIVDWIANRMQEFQEMATLCYEFADHMYTMELPDPSTVGLNNNVAAVLQRTYFPKIGHDRTIKLLDKVNWAIQNSRMVNFDWHDFFSTEYHEMLQRVPLRIGSVQLKFRTDGCFRDPELGHHHFVPETEFQQNENVASVRVLTYGAPTTSPSTTNSKFFYWD